MSPEIIIPPLLLLAGCLAYVFWPQPRLAAPVEKTRLDYLREKSALWDARVNDDATAESAAQLRVHAALSRLDMKTEIKR